MSLDGMPPMFDGREGSVMFSGEDSLRIAGCEVHVWWFSKELFHQEYIISN